jgi:hypothetical protein
MSWKEASEPPTGAAVACQPLPSRVAPVTEPPPSVMAPPPMTDSPCSHVAVSVIVPEPLDD